MTEDQLQQKIIMDFNNRFCLKNMNPRGIIFAVPNGGSRNIIEAKKLKATGVLAGVSDLICITPKGEIFFLELKTQKGIQSDSQKEFEAAALSAGYGYAVFRSLGEFQYIVRSYLNDGIY